MLRGTNCLAAAFCSVIFLTALDAEAARFYRHVDEQGNVSFSDRPSGSDAEQIEVKVFTPPPPAAEAKSKPADGEAKGDARKGKEGDAETDKASKEDVKALQAKREENCKIAKENLQKLQNISRLYTEDESGERTYMSDEDRLRELATAREGIKEWCK